MTEVDSDPVITQTPFESASRGEEDAPTKVELDDFKGLEEIQKSLDQIQFSDESP